ncbi:acyl-CoA N-acyltransferase [Artomyces pyxidatus]|uniref:Acyl-CoA N-acyltransferase n=1 Tax=Artomyces pyxidatus TaxID=48021 RepID=A0ACB8T4P6_9AGAM|nr:acyl-CoA N-acyltransferase [Artomyces pyxidatus]
MSPSAAARAIHVVSKNGTDHKAQILEHRAGEVYVHYIDTDKRLDEWVPDTSVRALSPSPSPRPASRKRRRTTSPTRAAAPDDASTHAPETKRPAPTVDSEEFDIQHHRQITARRNFDKVNFGHWQIKTWYFSPYPLSETETEDPPAPAETRIAGVARATLRSHGRTSDLLAGGLGREHGSGERSVLWVCDRCFKYMADGTSWEAHIRKCTRKHPPGRKVYQRGAHTIWEVDGAKEKLYCQNLSLFGKLFIDIKTLFFDCDNFLFYLFTDAESQRDHVLGFFSKEKVSYDDYNLACIIVLPPYQRQGYGMLMIEFSYELSRRSGRVGTPERPLSDLGLRSYLAYWVSTLIRFLRRLLSVLPPDLPKVTTQGRPPDLSHLRTPSADLRRRRSAKGWDGEVDTPPESSPSAAPGTPGADDDTLAALRAVETTANADGSATTHVVVRCTLADIARATNLRVEDTAFALNECGLLIRRYGAGGDAGVGAEDTIVISREMVEAVAKERGVKRMCIDMAHVLL